ncbi:mRNA-capping enzyme [Acrasis kona]|uniref:mRNA-capping enzyme n=1 Tax=Acrasis kona TaxID=1008807 RepID=A0AAW2YZL0_9EUKA
MKTNPDTQIDKHQTPQNETHIEPPSPNTSSRVASVLSKIYKWSELQRFGKPLADSHIIPHKTPIDNKYLLQHNQWAPFSALTFVDEQLKKGIVVGCIIDLTNHDMIYDVRSVMVPRDPERHFAECTVNCTCPKMPLKHVRIQCVSKEFPDNTIIKNFCETVDDFVQQFPNHYVGVHCSYGFNRTGFIVCSYLVESCHMHISDALKAFAQSRVPGIKHQNFVDELIKRYGHEGPNVQEDQHDISQKCKLSIDNNNTHP